MFYKKMLPVVGEPIPDGAEYRIPGCDWDRNNGDCPEFDNSDFAFEWRVPVPVVPLSVAVDAVMAYRCCNAIGWLSVVVCGQPVSAATVEELREKATAKLIELSNKEPQ